MPSTTRLRLHAAAIDAARSLIGRHMTTEDGEVCFDLPGFLAAVDAALTDVLWAEESPLDGYDLDTAEVARYLWCCLALENGDNPNGQTFMGRPIID